MGACMKGRYRWPLAAFLVGFAFLHQLAGDVGTEVIRFLGIYLLCRWAVDIAFNRVSPSDIEAAEQFGRRVRGWFLQLRGRRP